MQRLSAVRVFVCLGLVLTAVRLEAQTLPAAFRLEEDETLVTQDWARKADGPAAGGTVETRSTGRYVLELTEVAAAPGGTRALVEVIEYAVQEVTGGEKPVTRTGKIGLAGCVIRMRWDSEGRPEVERLERGKLAPNDRELLMDWTLEEVTSRGVILDHALAAGERWTLPPERFAPQLLAPSGAPPGIGDWQEKISPLAGALVATVESRAGDLATVRIAGKLTSARTFEGKAEEKAVGGTATTEVSLEGTLKVDCRRQLVLERRMERRTQAAGRVGDAEWKHTETVTNVRVLTPRQ